MGAIHAVSLSRRSGVVFRPESLQLSLRGEIIGVSLAQHFKGYRIGFGQHPHPIQ